MRKKKFTLGGGADGGGQNEHMRLAKVAPLTPLGSARPRRRRMRRRRRRRKIRRRRKC
jgi:hypothetical protein